MTLVAPLAYLQSSKAGVEDSMIALGILLFNLDIIASLVNCTA